MEEQTSQLTTEQWLIEEEERAEKTLAHMRSIWGSLRCETHPTFAYFEGYLSALRTIIRKMDL